MNNRFITFKLNDELWAIDIISVREITQGLIITPVPLSPFFVAGLANLRGQLITVIDVVKKIEGTDSYSDEQLNVGRKPDSEKKHCIILKKESELERVLDFSGENFGLDDRTIGLLVDSVGDVIIPAGNEYRDCADTNSTGKKEKKIIKGLMQHGDIVIRIISLPALLEYSNENAPIKI